MKALELNILNRLAPYEVEYKNCEHYFHTDFDIEYSVEFKYEPAFGGVPAYWFDLTNRSGKISPSSRPCATACSCVGSTATSSSSAMSSGHTT